MKNGYVLMLDILGFRNFVSKNSSLDFIEIWCKLKKELLETKRMLEESMGKIFTFEIMFLSDTLIIGCSDCRKSNTGIGVLVFLPDLIRSFFFRYMQEYKFFFRGAISFGEYFFSSEDNLVMGSAFDEASEWYESTDWIGIVLTPSAECCLELIAYDNKYEDIRIMIDESFVKYDNIPFKAGFRKICKYAFVWIDTSERLTPNLSHWRMILNVFANVRHSPQYSSKFVNTIEFMRKQLRIEDIEVIYNSE